MRDADPFPSDLTPRTADHHGASASALWRPAIITLVAALSTIFAAVILWTWVDPTVLASVGAAPLVALVAMFVLPAGVIWLDRVDRRLRAGHGDHGALSPARSVRHRDSRARATADPTVRSAAHRARRASAAQSARGRSPAAPRSRRVESTM